MSDPTPYHEVHEGNGPYLLLVHGLLSSRAQWLPNVAALACVARPVVLELYGHGRSPAPADPALYHPDAYVAAFERIRERLGAERWFVGGQSLGAALTLRYALAHAGRTLAQVVTNSNSAFAGEGWAEQVEPGMQATARALEREGAGVLERLPIHPRHARRIPDAVRAALVADAERADPRGIALSGLHTVVHSALGARVAENRVPTLLLFGAREERFRPHLERAKATMPALEVRELDAGHAVNLEAQPAFERHAVAFLRAHALGAPARPPTELS